MPRLSRLCAAKDLAAHGATPFALQEGDKTAPYHPSLREGVTKRHPVILSAAKDLRLCEMCSCELKVKEKKCLSRPKETSFHTVSLAALGASHFAEFTLERSEGLRVTKHHPVILRSTPVILSAAKDLVARIRPAELTHIALPTYR